MRLFRIAVRAYSPNGKTAFSGAGGIYGAGRWHTRGRPVVYCATRLSLSALESLVHLKRADQIQPYVHYEIDVPDNLIAPTPRLSANWKTNKLATQAIGDQWLLAAKFPALLVPSVIVASEFNVLLNPAHPAFSLRWVVRGPIPFHFDSRLTKP